MNKFIELETQYGLLVVSIDNIQSFTTSNLEVTPKYPTYIVFKNSVAKPSNMDIIETVVCHFTYNELKNRLNSDDSVIL